MASKGRNDIPLLCCLVILENANVLITRFTRLAVDPGELYDIAHLMLVTETAKLILATVMEVIHTNGNFWEAFQKHNLETVEGIKVALPAMLYFLQNTLFYVALSNLPSPIFQVSYQMKLLITAFVSVIVLRRRYSWKQWICLFFLTCGISAAASVKDNKSASLVEEMGNVRMTGLLAVLVASFCSALAGVTFEKFLKSAQQPTENEAPYLANPSLYMRNIQLATFSILCAFGQQGTRIKDTDNTKPYLHGFSAWVWLLVVLRSSTGLLVASIIKYTDNVVKGIASGVSVLLGCILAMFLFDTPLTAQFIMGAALVILSTYFFSNDLPSTEFLSKWLSFTEKGNRSRLFMWIMVVVLSVRNLQNPTGIPPLVDTMMVKTSNSSLVVIDPTGVPENYRDELHFAIVITGDHFQVLHGDCGGCKVLWGLHDILKASNFSVGPVRYKGVPCDLLLQQSRQMNRTQVIVWPEIATKHCPGNATEIINVRWILAPVETYSSLEAASNWPPQDLVFNYATSTGKNVSINNILQILLNPVEGDVTDIPDSVFYSKERSGVAWLMRKGPKFHKNITYIHEQPGLNSTEFDSKKQTVESLHQFEYFVTYDPYTYWSWFAAMSGTVSVVYPLENTTKEEWALGTFLGSYLQAVGDTTIPGVAYGWTEEEIQYARSTMHELRGFLLKVKEWGASVTVPRFTRDVYRYRHGLVDQFEGALIRKDVY